MVNLENFDQLNLFDVLYLPSKKEYYLVTKTPNRKDLPITGLKVYKLGDRKRVNASTIFQHRSIYEFQVIGNLHDIITTYKKATLAHRS